MINKISYFALPVLLFACKGNKNTVVESRVSGNINKSQSSEKKNSSKGIKEYDLNENKILVNPEEDNYSEVDTKKNESDDNSSIKSTEQQKGKINITSFIKHLYNSKIVFNEKCGCTTNATFVFEDNDSKIFNMLVKSCFKTRKIGSEILKDYEEGAVNNVSQYNIFNKRKINEYIDGTYDVNYEIWKTKRLSLDTNDTGPLLKFMAYEYELNCPLSSLCKEGKFENECDNKQNCKTKRTENNKKNIIVFYRFRTRKFCGKPHKILINKKCDDNKKGRSDIEKTYVVIKLQKDRTSSLRNLENEFVDNINKNIKHQISRHEMDMKDMNMIDDDNEMLSKLSDIDLDKEMESVNFYNDKIRSGNEIFIPQGVTDQLYKGLK